MSESHPTKTAGSSAKAVEHPTKTAEPHAKADEHPQKAAEHSAESPAEAIEHTAETAKSSADKAPAEADEHPAETTEHSAKADEQPKDSVKQTVEVVSHPSEIVGKKIFFLHPTAIVRNEIIIELAQQEYEVYEARNTAAMKRVLKKYPDSIVFVDINEDMHEPEWEKWIVAVQTEFPKINIGILSAARNEEIVKKYEESIKVPCGYIVLRSDIKWNVSRLLDTLKKTDAKGRRKYIRASTEKETNTTVNMPYGADFKTGNIKDISVVGFLCNFLPDLDLQKNSLIKDVQIKLQTALIKVDAIVFGSRPLDYGKDHVMLFTKKTSPEIQSKIRKYIQHYLQSKMDLELK